MLEQVSQNADRVFDAVGGGLANAMLSVLPEHAALVSYGLLSGQALSQTRTTPRDLSTATWQAAFREIWSRLPATSLPAVEVIPVSRWQEAISASAQGGGHAKMLLDFTAED